MNDRAWDVRDELAGLCDGKWRRTQQCYADGRCEGNCGSHDNGPSALELVKVKLYQNHGVISNLKRAGALHARRTSAADRRCSAWWRGRPAALAGLGDVLWRRYQADHCRVGMINACDRARSVACLTLRSCIGVSNPSR